MGRHLVIGVLALAGVACGVPAPHLTDTPIPPPIASFDLELSGGSAPLAVQFSDTSKGSINSYDVG